MRKVFLILGILIFLTSPVLAGFGGILKEDTAVDVLIGPFIDDTDGKTAETGLTLAQADVKLSKNGQALAQKTEASASAHDANGYYNCVLDTTDTNTSGQLTLIVHEAGALPVRVDFQIVSGKVWDSLYGADGVDKLEVDLLQMGGAAQSATDLKDFADAGYDPATDKVQGVVLTDTCTANSDLVSAASVVNEWETQSQADPTGFHTNVLEIGGTGQTANDNGADINAILTDTSTTLDALIKDIPTTAEFELRSLLTADYTIVGDLGTVQTGDSYAIVNGAHGLVSIQDDIDAVLLDTAVIGALGAGLTGIPWNSAWDAEVESEVNDALVILHLDHLLSVDYDPASKPGTATALLNELIENDGGVSRYTANALEEAPSGTGASAVSIRQEMDNNSTKLIAIVEDTGTTIPGTITTLQNDLDILTGTDGATLATAQGNYAPNKVIPDAAGTLATYDPSTNTEMVAAFTEIKGPGFTATTDQLEDIIDRGNGYWVSATGFSTHSAANVWSVGTRTLTLYSDSAGVTTLLNRVPDTISLDNISDSFYEELMSGHTTTGSFGLHFQRLR